MHANKHAQRVTLAEIMPALAPQALVVPAALAGMLWASEPSLAAPGRDISPLPAWSYALGSAVATRVAVAGDSVYAAGQDGSLHALHIHDGSRQWVKRDGSQQRVKNGAETDEIVTDVAVAGPLVVVGSFRGVLTARHRSTGTIRWQKRVPGPMHPQMAVNETLLVVADRGGYLWGIDRATGRRLWVENLEVVASPHLTEDGRLLVSTTRGVAEVEPRTGQPTWRFRVAMGQPGPLLTHRGTVFFATSEKMLYGVTIRAQRRRWRRPLPHQAIGQLSFLNDTIIVATAGKAVLGIDTSSGGLRWHTRVEGAVSVLPLVGEQQLIVSACDGKHVRLDAMGNHLNWRSDMGTYVTSAPRRIDNLLLQGGWNGTLNAIRLP